MLIRRNTISMPIFRKRGKFGRKSVTVIEERFAFETNRTRLIVLQRALYGQLLLTTTMGHLESPDDQSTAKIIELNNFFESKINIPE